MKIAVKIFCLLHVSLMIAGEVEVAPERTFALTDLQTKELSAAIERCKYECSINPENSYYMQRQHELAVAALHILQRNYPDNYFDTSCFKSTTTLVPDIYFGKRFYYRDKKTQTVFMSWGSFKNGYVSLGRKVAKESVAKRHKRK